MLFLDGVYLDARAAYLAFHSNKAPTAEQLTEVLQTISQRVARFWKGEDFCTSIPLFPHITLNQEAYARAFL